MDELIKILKNIKTGKISPIYFLMGEETYYIDKLSDYIEKNVLTEDQKEFNQTIVYGRDVNIDEIIAYSKRYPMMSDRQVIIIKEAQDLAKTIEKLEVYVQQPMLTTVLVICYKFKTLDKRKKITKLLEKNAVIYESKKLTENQVGDWINKILKQKGYTIERNANAILIEFLGTDLSKIEKELEKLQIILPVGSLISAKDIEDNVGFSKDFNVFELRKALGSKNQLKSYQIVQYFADNPKDNNIVMVVGLIYAFFIQLLKYHCNSEKNPLIIAKVIGVNPFYLKEYEIGIKNYSLKKLSRIVSILRDIDIKSKGIGANSLPLKDLYKEMLIGIFV